MATYVEGDCNSGTTASITCDNIWYTWNFTANSSDVTWTTWVTDDWACTGNAITVGRAAPWPQVTEEERAAREEARLEAVEKADALLQENLSEEQRRELEEHRYFTVESPGSKRRYRVKAGHGKHGNIIEVDERGREVSSICAAPRGNVPEGDYLLAQKLFLEHDEEEFRRIANHRRIA